jgi:hypothetical protein
MARIAHFGTGYVLATSGSGAEIGDLTIASAIFDFFAAMSRWC